MPYKATAGCIAIGGVYNNTAKPLQMKIRANPLAYQGALQVMLAYEAKAKIDKTLRLYMGGNGALTIGKPNNKALDKATRKAYGANTLARFMGVGRDAKGVVVKVKGVHAYVCHNQGKSKYDAKGLTKIK